MEYNSDKERKKGRLILKTQYLVHFLKKDTICTHSIHFFKKNTEILLWVLEIVNFIKYNNINLKNI